MAEEGVRRGRDRVAGIGGKAARLPRGALRKAGVGRISAIAVAPAPSKMWLRFGVHIPYHPEMYPLLWPGKLNRVQAW